MLDSEIPATFAGDGTTMASFGEELRRQRELRSVSLREISDATKINIRFLEALEENDFKHLPGGQFNKGFIRAYARHIGVDGEDMVNAYTLEVRRQEDEAPSARTSPARARLDPADKRALIALGILAAIVVLLGLGIWYVFFHGRKEKTASAPATRTGQASRSRAPEAAPSNPPAPGASPAAKTSAPAGGEAFGGVESGGESSAASAARPSDESAKTDPARTPAMDRADARAAAGANVGVEMTLRVVPLASARFGLLCNGKEAFSGTLEPGHAQSFTCAGVYEISLDDAGAVNLSIDGDRIYVGRKGQSIAGRHVSRANLPDFLDPPFEPAGR
jgi:cytoskeletal protein RodZ